MTKIITCAELRRRRLEELRALFRSLEAELVRTALGSPSYRSLFGCQGSTENRICGSNPSRSTSRSA